MPDGSKRAVRGRAAHRISAWRGLQTTFLAANRRGSRPCGQPENPTPSTLDIWQRRARGRLSDEDARQIRENLCGFFRVLAEWNRLSPTGGAHFQAPDRERNRP